jgi:hypothetical protein
MELTHNYSLMLPLLAASIAAYGFTVLLQRRSILTERLSRRGYHLSREYAVDPLETMTVSQVINMNDIEVDDLPEAENLADMQLAWPDETLRSLVERMASAHVFEAYVKEPGTSRILGRITLQDMLHARTRSWQREMVRQRLRRLPFSGEPPGAETSMEPS